MRKPGYRNETVGAGLVPARLMGEPGYRNETVGAGLVPSLMGKPGRDKPCPYGFISIVELRYSILTAPSASGRMAALSKLFF